MCMTLICIIHHTRARPITHTHTHTHARTHARTHAQWLLQKLGTTCTTWSHRAITIWSSWERHGLDLLAMSVKWLQWHHLVSLGSLYLGLLARGVDLLCCSGTVWWIVLKCQQRTWLLNRSRCVKHSFLCVYRLPPSRKNKLSNKMFLDWRVPRSTWVVRFVQQTFCSWRHNFSFGL